MAKGASASPAVAADEPVMDGEAAALLQGLMSAWLQQRLEELKPADVAALIAGLGGADQRRLKAALKPGPRATEEAVAGEPLTEAAPQTTDAILTAAQAIFLEQGYAANLDAVAQMAGVSKRTIYTHFSGKEHLFRAALDRLKFDMNAKLKWSDAADIQSELVAYGRQVRAYVLSDKVLKAFRLVERSMPEMPDLGVVAEQHTTQLLEALAAYFNKGMKAGVFIDTDPRFLAEHFFSMVIGQSRSRALRGLPPEPHRDDAYLNQEIEIFVRGISAA